MTRLFASLRWRYVRWAALAAIIPVLWACNARKLKPPTPGTKGVEKNTFVQSLNRDIDMLFMVDNSSSMTPMQALLVQNLPAFMNVLKALPGGLPNLRVAVVSSSMGAGIWGDVPGCFQQAEQNDDGAFRHVGVNPAGCSGPSGNYIIADEAGNNNFTGDISDAFSCIAAIGDKGCGFEHQFRSVEAALQRTTIPGDVNEGFLRDDAYLAIIMLTNEDDCSVPWDSTLLDPRQSHVTDELGGLQTGYRCNEFGHLCDPGSMTPPPHTVTGDTTLQGCVSAEGAGRLVPVDQFVESIKGFKSDPTNQIFVAALAGPVTPYIVELRRNVMTTDGGLEDQPAIAHSCGPRMVPAGSQTVFADPSIRIKRFIDAFGDHGVFENICNADFAGAMRRIAEELSKIIGPQCLQNRIAQVEDGTMEWTPNGGGTPDCQVALRRRSDSGMMVEEPLQQCDGAVSSVPCWRIVGRPTSTACDREVQVCYNTQCTVDARPSNAVNAQVACALFLPP